MPLTDTSLVEIHIRERREAQGLFLQQVAPQCGISHSYLARGELGESDLRLCDVARLARVLDCNPWHLISYVGYPLPCGCCCHGTAKET